MKEIKDPKYIVFVKTSESTVRQVMFDDAQQIAIQHFINLIVDGELKLGPEKPVRMANEKV